MLGVKSRDPGPVVQAQDQSKPTLLGSEPNRYILASSVIFGNNARLTRPIWASTMSPDAKLKVHYYVCTRNSLDAPPGVQEGILFRLVMSGDWLYIFDHRREFKDTTVGRLQL